MSSSQVPARGRRKEWTADGRRLGALHDVGRFTRGLDVRIYRLRVVSSGAGLWMTMEAPGRQPESIMERTSTTLLKPASSSEMLRTLKGGGWSRSRLEDWALAPLGHRSSRKNARTSSTYAPVPPAAGSGPRAASRSSA